MAVIYQFPKHERQNFGKQYIFEPRQTPADVGFVSTQNNWIETTQKHLSGMITFSALEGPYETEEGRLSGNSMLALCELILRIPQDEPVSEEGMQTIREFLSRLTTARFFLENLEIDDTDGC